MNTQSAKEEKNSFQILLKLKSELESGITNPVDKIDRPSLKLPVEFPDPDEYDSYEPEITKQDMKEFNIDFIAGLIMEDEGLDYDEARERAIEEVREMDEEEAWNTEMQEYEEDLEMDLDDGGLSRVNLKKSNRKHSKVRKLRDQ